ncbi:MAG: S8 family serine peptidase [Actinobacteria bacterium]|nr:S8 family serine peptidase [Actinomycetota bacterium]
MSSSGSGAWSNLIADIDWGITNRMRIVSMSLGAPSAPSAVETICTTAWSKGLLLITAAGNDGGPVGAPAKFDSVVPVSAFDSHNLLAPFSNRGPEVELCAPGVNVLLNGHRRAAVRAARRRCRARPQPHHCVPRPVRGAPERARMPSVARISTSRSSRTIASTVASFSTIARP